MLDRAVLSVLGLFAGVLASTVTPVRGQNEGRPYFRSSGWTVESLVVDGGSIGCIARTRSTDDGTFAISAVGEREWKAAFKPRDGFKPKLKRSVTLVVDGRQIAKATEFVDKDGFASIGSLEPTETTRER